MLSNITWGTYIFFAVWLLLGGLFVFFFVPETRGKTLEEMDAAFGSNTSSEDVARLKQIQDDIGLSALLQQPSFVGEAEKGYAKTESMHVDV